MASDRTTGMSSDDDREQIYHTLVEHTLDAIYIITPSGFEYVNPAFEELTGYEADEVCTEDFDFWEIIHPDDRSLIRQREQARERGEELEPAYQFRIVSKDGGIRHVEANTVALPGEDTRVVGMLRDVTERERSLARLKTSERKYRTLFESANDAIFLMTEDVFIDCNQKALAMFGCKKENIIGHSPGEFSPPRQPDGSESGPEARAYIRAALQGEPQRFYWKHVRMDGTPFDAEVSLNRIELEDSSMVQAVVRDVTKQKRAEEALRVAEENYKNIFRNAVMGIYKSTAEGYHISVNPALARIYGYDSPEELMHGMRDIATQLYVDPERRAELVRRLREEGRVIDFESQVYRKDGEVIWISESARTVRDEDGEIAYFVGTVEDITDRKRMEKALRESEARYEAFFDRTMLAVYIHDFSGNFIDANQAARDLLGYSVEEIPTLVFARLLDGEGQVERMEETIEEIRETGTQEEPTEYRLRTRQGDVVWVETEGSLVYRGGEPYAVQVIARDITKRKRAQLALERSETKFRNLVENANDAIYIIHPEEGFQYVNPAFEDIIGYDAETIYSDAFSFWDVIHPDDRAIVKKRAAAREGGEDIPSRYEFRVMAADGATRVVEVTTVAIGAGDEPLVMGILRDITDRIEMERALKESEEKFRLLAEASASAIFIHRGDVFEYGNPAMEEMLGYDREELEQMSFWEVVHPDHRDLVRERGRQRIAGESSIPERYEIKVTTRDGVVKWIDLTATAIIYNGEPAVLGTAYDITERKRAYEEMERALEKERVFKLKTAHHFFNPISIAKGYIDLVSEDISEEDRQKILAARGAIQRVESVVKNATQRGEICE